MKIGESLVTIHANRENVDDVVEKIYANIRISNDAELPVLIYDTIVETII